MKGNRNGTAQEIFSACVEFYGQELERTGFRPDHTSTRDSRTVFLQKVVRLFCHPYVAMKRADTGRPISDEAIVICKPGEHYRWFGDFIISGGTADWRLTDHMEGYLPVAQPLVSPLMELYAGASTPGYMAEPLPGGVVPTVPGCVAPLPPTPEPEPEPPAPMYPSYEELGGDEGGKKITRMLEADYKEAGRPGLDRDCGAWQQRVSYDFLTRKVPTVEESINKHRPDWRKALGLPPL